jgi:23S rRNA G2069 N7-methylase RlmK/C1962 C5-methylase RlmI
LFSFVLQHLPHQSEDELQRATQAVLDGATSVLAPGGHIIIVTCSREQMSPEAGCMWYYKYFAEAANKLASALLAARDHGATAAKHSLSCFSCKC